MNQNDILNENNDEAPTNIRLIGLRQVSDILGLSHNATYKLVMTRQIKSVKIGARRLFTVQAVHDYIKSLEEKYETQV